MNNQSNNDYIYIAIRRGSLFPPESATEVFDIATGTSNPPFWKAPFAVDVALSSLSYNDTHDTYATARLVQGKVLVTQSAFGDINDTNWSIFDYQNGVGALDATSPTFLSWMWKRAPGFCDVVAYTGDGTAGRDISHNLGAVPEMIWVKRRDTGSMDWYVYHKDIDVNNDNQPWTDFVKLNTNAPVADGNVWADTAPTDSVFTVNNQSYINQNNGTFIAFLFSTLDGISKVGGYTGDGTNNRVIDCGFTAGARFVLIRNATSSGSWYVWDATRGLVSGNDSMMWLNQTTPADTTQDMVDPHNSGFTVSEGLYENEINVSGTKYIFYAIA